jgi:hypothetical protein
MTMATHIAAAVVQREDGKPARAGGVVVVGAGGRDLRIHPYLFQVADFDVRLEKEHVAYEWINPPEVTGYDTVPQLDDDLRALGLL